EIQPLLGQVEAGDVHARGAQHGRGRGQPERLAAEVVRRDEEGGHWTIVTRATCYVLCATCITCYVPRARATCHVHVQRATGSVRRAPATPFLRRPSSSSSGS